MDNAGDPGNTGRRAKPAGGQKVRLFQTPYSNPHGEADRRAKRAFVPKISRNFPTFPGNFPALINFWKFANPKKPQINKDQ